MIFLYLIIALIINVMNLSSQVISGINTACGSSLSGSAMFWIGLLVAAILELLLGGN